MRLQTRFGYDLHALGDYFKAMRAADAAQWIIALTAAPISDSAPVAGEPARAGLALREEPADYNAEP